MPIFTLLGFDTPAGDYPGFAIPVGLLDGRMVAVYNGAPDHIPNDARYQKLSSKQLALAVTFDHLTNRLFAISADNLVCYRVDHEPAVFADLLNDPALEHANPFLLISMAYASRRPGLIEPAILKGYNALAGSPNYRVQWLREEIREMLNAGMKISESIAALNVPL